MAPRFAFWGAVFLPVATVSSRNIIGKDIAAVVKIPAQRAFSKAAAAQYLGISPNTLLDMTAAGVFHPVNMRGRRAWMLDDLDRYLNSLEPWHGKR